MDISYTTLKLPEQISLPKEDVSVVAVGSLVTAIILYLNSRRKRCREKFNKKLLGVVMTLLHKYYVITYNEFGRAYLHTRLAYYVRTLKRIQVLITPSNYDLLN